MADATAADPRLKATGAPSLHFGRPEGGAGMHFGRPGGVWHALGALWETYFAGGELLWLLWKTYFCPESYFAYFSKPTLGEKASCLHRPNLL